MVTLYPMKFEPIFKSMLWGGRRLPGFVNRPAPHDDPIGEAWVLSDVDGNVSTVANGRLQGKSLRDVVTQHARAVFGEVMPADGKFPLLLKFIDARQELSVQVHPNDEQAVRMKGEGFRGKTEAWVILHADPETSKIYAGFRPGVTADEFRTAMQSKTTPQTLHSFTPTHGDCVFLRAGTVHAIGANILLFEVQQTSDITYRLYDWDRVDAKTGQPRQLHVEDGLTCSDFAKGPCHPVTPQRVGDRDNLVDCEYFTLDHTHCDTPLTVGAVGQCRVVVCIQGSGTVGGEPIAQGEVILLPASVGTVQVVPSGSIRLLECGIGA